MSTVPTIPNNTVTINDGQHLNPNNNSQDEFNALLTEFMNKITNGNFDQLIVSEAINDFMTKLNVIIDKMIAEMKTTPNNQEGSVNPINVQPANNQEDVDRIMNDSIIQTLSQYDKDDLKDKDMNSLLLMLQDYTKDDDSSSSKDLASYLEELMPSNSALNLLKSI